MKDSNFKIQQLEQERVKAAYDCYWGKMFQNLKHLQEANNFNLFLVAYKNEEILEIWIQGAQHLKYELFKTYKFSAKSGHLGPKRYEGDLQIPEGFYEIEAFNPKSKYHLSLKINYPNAVDLIRTGIDHTPGGDIYVHGGQKSVGCIAIGDENCSELYVLAVEAKNAGQNNIPLYIFPFKMSEKNISNHIVEYPQQVEFWETLKIGYDYLSEHHKALQYTMHKGKYIFQ